MGYLHDTVTYFHVPVTLFHYVTGTWTFQAGVVADTICARVNDAAQTSVCTIPLIIPSNSAAGKGSYLKTIEVDYEVLGASLTQFVPQLTIVTRGANTAAATTAVRNETRNILAAQRIVVDQHRLIATLDSPLWITNNQYCLYKCPTIQAGDGGVIEYLGAWVGVVYRA